MLYWMAYMEGETKSFKFANQDGDYVPLTSYGLVAASWWREIFFGAALVAVTGGALVFLVTVVAPRYSASADVAIVDTSATVSLDETFRAAEDLFQRGRANSNAHLARRAALLGLVKNGGVVNAMVASLDWLEKDDPVALNELIEAVSAELVTIGAVTDRNQSDLLRITFESDSPEKSVHAVNIWATEYVEEANRVFSSVTPEVISNIQNRLETAGEDYAKAQMELEGHLARVDSEQLERSVNLKRADIERLQEARRSLMDMLFNVETSRRSELLDERHATQRKLETLLENAVSLARHVAEGGEASVLSNSLAIQLLKIQAYGLTGATAGLEISFRGNEPVHIDKAALLADINSFITATQHHLGVLEKAIALNAAEEISQSEDSSEVIETLNDAILLSQNSFEKITQSLENDIQDIVVLLESASARNKLLTQQRDLAYSNLETLQNELVELQLTAISGQSLVRLGSPAVASASTRPHPALVGAVLGAVMPPILALFALFLNSMGVQPFLSTIGKRAPGEETSDDSLHPGPAIGNRLTTLEATRTHEPASQ